MTVVPERFTYGPDPSQYAELYRPAAGVPVRGTCVVIHGGFWKALYGIEYAQPLATDLAERGWIAWAPEYRRVGNGGGVPATLDDLDASFTRLVETGVDTSALIVLGHSAGGHLALWSAARGRFARWRGGGRIRAVFNQAGVADLEQAYADGLGGGAVDAFAGAPSATYDEADPTRHLPLEVPVWCFHARDDDAVPFSQSVDYVARARAAGGEATLVEVRGGHFGVVDVAAPAWQAQLQVLESFGNPPDGQ